MSESSGGELKPEDWLWLVTVVAGGLLLLILICFCLARGKNAQACAGALMGCIFAGKDCCGCWCENIFCRADAYCDPCGVRRSRMMIAAHEDPDAPPQHPLAVLYAALDYHLRRNRSGTSSSSNPPLLHSKGAEAYQKTNTTSNSPAPRMPLQRPDDSDNGADVQDATEETTVERANVLNQNARVAASALRTTGRWNGLPLRPIVLGPPSALSMAQRSGV